MLPFPLSLAFSILPTEFQLENHFVQESSLCGMVRWVCKLLITYHVLTHPRAFRTLFHSLFHWTEGQSVMSSWWALPAAVLIQFSVFPRRLQRELDWHHHCRHWAQKPKTLWWQSRIQCPLAAETVSIQAPVKKYFMWREHDFLACIYLVHHRFISIFCLRIFQTLLTQSWKVLWMRVRHLKSELGTILALCKHLSWSQFIIRIDLGWVRFERDLRSDHWMIIYGITTSNNWLKTKKNNHADVKQWLSFATWGKSCTFLFVSRIQNHEL